MSKADIYDVAVVGFGPGGEIAAATIGARGHRVIAIEQHLSPYPLPRAVTFDGETCRAIQATGADMTHALQRSTVLPEALFVTADDVPIFSHDWSGELCGYASRQSIFQPDIEAALYGAIARMDNVAVERGTKVTGLAQDDEGVDIEAVAADGVSHSYRARYVIGADGANSFVRETLNFPVYRSGFRSSVLNFDMQLLRPIPERFGGFRMTMDPERPHMFMPIGSDRMRFEMFLKPGDQDSDFLHEEIVWNWLETKHGLGPQDLKLNRQLIYHFGSAVCQQWRSGRAFVLGDAAHSMAPHLGQGANSAFRDARNLSWKLAMVLEGLADERLLDTYESEVKPFVTQIVEESERVARFSLIVDEEVAAKRDVELAQESEPSEVWQWPVLSSGVITQALEGGSGGVAGRVARQGRISRGGQTGLADDVLGAGFQLISMKPIALSADQRRFLNAIGCAVGIVGAPLDEDGIVDLDGRYTEYLGANGVDLIVMRPDFYVFGAGLAEHAGLLVDELRVLLGFIEPATSGTQARLESAN